MTQLDEERIERLGGDLAGRPLPKRLALIREALPGRIVFTTSFGLEDQALTHAIVASGARIEIVTLDTGRLFAETHDVWAATEARYGIRIPAFAPRGEAVERFVRDNGINGFRNSVEARKACCSIRKVEPLGRALAGATGWVTGLRAEQSSNRAATPLASLDPAFGLVKLNPLADWSRQTLGYYVVDHDIPYNVLHDRGFPSIGCAPCTRAIRVGESERAGRWWWEDDARKECGLHKSPAGPFHAGAELKAVS